MFPFTGVHTREDTGGRSNLTAIKCTCCCVSHCLSTAVIRRKLMKRHQNQHQHYCRDAGRMVNINFSAIRNSPFLSIWKHIRLTKKCNIEMLWFQSVLGETEHAVTIHNWRTTLLTQLPKMRKSQTAPPPSIQTLTTSLIKKSSWFLQRSISVSR